MKITKSRLKQIIKEELEKTLLEAFPRWQRTPDRGGLDIGRFTTRPKGSAIEAGTGFNELMVDYYREIAKILNTKNVQGWRGTKTKTKKYLDRLEIWIKELKGETRGGRTGTGIRDNVSGMDVVDPQAPESPSFEDGVPPLTHAQAKVGELRSRLAGQDSGFPVEDIKKIINDEIIWHGGEVESSDVQADY